MPYVGNVPALKYASFAVQHFTTSATTGYTLDNAVTNENDIRLVINNVVQQPGSGKAYTATGTVLTLSAATTSSDTMYCVFLGKAVQTVNPGAGSVGTSQLADESVNEAKLKVSNSPSNGQVLSAQSGAAGGLTWAADAAGTITAFTNGVDDRVVTATSATALNGEATFTYNGVTAEITGSAPVMKINSTADSSLQFLAGTSSTCGIQFGDSGDSGIGSINYINTDDSIRVSVNGGEQVRIFSNGVMAAADGVALGVGIANTAANVLDDYEEGTWTPSLGGTTAYTTQTGTYTKIGRSVTIQGHLYISTIGTGSTTSITGLPFAATQPQPGSVNIAKWANLSQSVVDLTGVIPAAGGTQVNATGMTAAAATNTENLAVIQGTTIMFFSATYFTT